MTTLIRGPQKGRQKCYRETHGIGKQASTKGEGGQEGNEGGKQTQILIENCHAEV